ncbi:hypothetical protein ACSBR2_012875 [Camellia fascicularis]
MHVLARFLSQLRQRTDDRIVLVSNHTQYKQRMQVVFDFVLLLGHLLLFWEQLELIFFVELMGFFPGIFVFCYCSILELIFYRRESQFVF